MINSDISQYEKRKDQLEHKLATLSEEQKLQIRKKTVSNLFRYQLREKAKGRSLALSDFTHVLTIDEKNKILDVEGLTSYETIIQHTLPKGLIPTVTPELKHITIGGAIVGIGIESTSYQYGFVHDGLLEAEVLLPEGKIVICTPTNEYADLFRALPNSYGTLGYVLRAKIRLIESKPFVRVNITRFSDISSFLTQMNSMTQNQEITFMEAIIYSKNEIYLCVGKPVETAPFLSDIYKHSYYKSLKEHKELFFTAKDYIFRYDPDWFGNIPDTPFFTFFRLFCPRRWRHSALYKKYMDTKTKWVKKFSLFPSREAQTEILIQDWEVPWDRSKELLEFALDKVDLNGLPWLAIAIKPSLQATLYPMKDCPLYFNLGSYGFAKKSKEGKFHLTELIDNYCFSLDGIKMLYSSSFLNRSEFDAIYNGKAYKQLKQKYDPHQRLPYLFEKCNISPEAKE